MESSFSYSKIDTFDKCKFKYKLKYIDKLRPKNTDTVATKFGTLVHETEEKIAKFIIAEEPIDYVSLKNNFIIQAREIAFKYPTEYVAFDKSDRNYIMKAQYYLDFGIYRLEQFMKNHPSYRIVGVEVPFEIQHLDRSYNGIIDRILYDNATNQYIIQDIKTWATPKSATDLATPLQFVIYVLAAKQMFNIVNEQITCQYDLPLCDTIQEIISKGYMTRGLKKLDKLFEEINAGNYEPNPGPLCHFCEYCATNSQAEDNFKHLCPYFCHWTRENKSFTIENKWTGLDQYPIILESYLKKKGGEIDGSSCKSESSSL